MTAGKSATGGTRNRAITESEAYREMVRRGIEISEMIKIFLMIKHRMPAVLRKKFDKLARGYAIRNDKGRGCERPGEIEYQDDGIRIKKKSVEERSGCEVYRCRV